MSFIDFNIIKEDVHVYTDMLIFIRKWTPHPSVMMDEGHYLSKPEASMYDIAIGLAR